ncbi:MAG: lipase family protein [Janthinobacterium lividum]
MKIRFIISFILFFSYATSYANTYLGPHDNGLDLAGRSYASKMSSQQNSFDDYDRAYAQTYQKFSTFDEIQQIKQTPAKVYASFVKELGNNKFEVADDIQKVIPTLIDMNLLTYAMGRGESDKIIFLTELFSEQGWEIRPFSGFTGKGNRVEDIPGFVAYNRMTNQFTIAIRGSQTKEDEEGSADWEVNFDAQMMQTDYGKMHRGFYQRTTAMMANITTQIRSFYQDMSIQDRKNARIMVTGHSQGAALATLVSAMLTENLKDDLLLGKDFDNKKSNTIVSYLLSAPRVGDQKAREWIHATVGKENIIRQNVTGGFLSDPVPSGSPGKTMTNLLSKIPFVGNKLAQRFGGDGGGASMGYLAADLSKDALTRRIEPETNALYARTMQKINNTKNELSADLKQNPFRFFKRLAPVSLKVALSTGRDALETYFAGLHYGGTMNQPKSGAYFQPNVVAGYLPNTPALNQLLEQGAIKKQKSTLWGRIKSIF